MPASDDAKLPIERLRRQLQMLHYDFGGRGLREPLSEMFYGIDNRSVAHHLCIAQNLLECLRAELSLLIGGKRHDLRSAERSLLATARHHERAGYQCQHNGQQAN